MYDNGYNIEDVHIWNEKKNVYESKQRTLNMWRGHHSSSFGKDGYFMKDAGYGKLEKLENGHYKTIR